MTRGFVRRTLTLTAAVVAAMTMLSGCGGSGEKRAASQAVVIVSGGDATSPFTTPDQACATGLAAGNTATAIDNAPKALQGNNREDLPVLVSARV